MTDSDPVQITHQDRENFRIRQQIAARFAEEYGRVFALALSVFGPGNLPSCRHFLLDRSEEDRGRHAGERPKAAKTVSTVKHEETGVRRHFTVENGNVVEHASMEEGFGAMLLEPDLNRTIEVRGQHVHPHRYSLCWSDFPLYTPKSAEALAALRVSRQRGKAERERRKSEQDNPLLAWPAAGRRHAGRLARANERGRGAASK
jgi:hypothetical protein